jgi:antitoxin VapB
MHHRAKLFQTGGSQAVRLPREYRFPDGVTEIAIRKEGSTLIFELLDEWPPGFFEALGVYPQEIERPEGSPLRDPFESRDP